MGDEVQLTVLVCAEGVDAPRLGQIDRAFIATVGSDKDTYQGVQPFNLGSSEWAFGVYIAPAASIVGMIGETRIQIFDDNMDGMYGGEPKSWPATGRATSTTCRD